MTHEADVYRALLLACFALAGVTFFATGVLTAPYGRHTRGGWGPTVPKRLGWFLMESPSVVVFGAIFLMGSRSDEWIPRLFALMWLAHYLQRAWLDPFLMRGASGQRMPVVVVAMAITFNTLNSYLNARWLSELGPGYTWRWLLDPRFLYGMLLFVGGYLVNRWADAVLIRLRRDNDGYAIPRGGLYEDISCPNYFGELVQWFGWAIATWSLGGLSFAVFSFANLVPRAVAHHAWYRRQFPDYPRRRRAIFPGLL